MMNNQDKTIGSADIIQLSDHLIDQFEDRSGETGIEKTGGGSNNGGMEARVAKLEATTAHILTTLQSIDGRLVSIGNKIDANDGKRERDFRLLFGAVITVALGLGAMMLKLHDVI